MSLYYSGQGKFLVAERDANGNATGFRELGNVPSATIDIEVDKFEHKESKSGSRAIDLTILKEKKASVKLTLEDFDLNTLALGLYGTRAEVAAGSAISESIFAPNDLSVGSDRLYIPTLNPNITAITSVTYDPDGAATLLVLDTDYTFTAGDNGIRIIQTSSAVAVEGTKMEIIYDHGANVQLDVFTETSMERWVRFEGVNTIEGGKDIIVDMFRVSFDPMTGYGLINEDVGSVELNGSILYDDKRVSGSNFFTQREIT
jgi:hypothetical protein